MNNPVGNRTLQQIVEEIKFEYEMNTLIARLDDKKIAVADTSEISADQCKFDLFRSLARYTRTILLVTRCKCTRIIEDGAEAQQTAYYVPLFDLGSPGPVAGVRDLTKLVNGRRVFTFKGKLDGESGVRIFEESQL